MADNTVRHIGWIPANPSMNQGSELCPDSDALYGSAAGGDVLQDDKESLKLGADMTPDAGGEGLTPRIMEDGIDYTMPDSQQGNLEHRSVTVRGAEPGDAGVNPQYFAANRKGK